jgi:hypothetical protein
MKNVLLLFSITLTVKKIRLGTSAAADSGAYPSSRDVSGVDERSDAFGAKKTLQTSNWFFIFCFFVCLFTGFFRGVALLSGLSNGA